MTYSIETQRELLQPSWIEYLSYSSMKELRNNELLFFKKYINYEFDNNIRLSTIIGKCCHHALELFYTDIEENKALYHSDFDFLFEKVSKFAKDYAFEEYLQKYQKPPHFWNSQAMISFGGYDDLRKQVDEYKALLDEVKGIDDTSLFDDKKKEVKDMETAIKKTIEKHKKKDEKLDNFINWWKEWSIEKIMTGIEWGLKNWFSQVYPKIIDWKLIGTEYNRTLPVTDMEWKELVLPLKVIIDVLFETPEGDIVIVDWKFKSQLKSDEYEFSPEYDMQWSTYFYGVVAWLDQVPTKALFIEVKPSQQKAPYFKQPELRDMCDENGIDRATGNNGKYMTNDMMTAELIAQGVLELAPIVNEYTVDFQKRHYVLDMWQVFYNQTIKRLMELLVENDEFVPNIFDGNFGGWVIAYQEWMQEYTQKDVIKVFDPNDVVDL